MKSPFILLYFLVSSFFNSFDWFSCLRSLSFLFLLLFYTGYWLMKGIVDLTIWNLNLDLQLMAGQKIFTTPRGGLVRLFGLSWSFTPNRCLSPQKEISVGAHLLPPKIERRNLEKSTFLKKNLKKIWRFRNFCDPEVAEISVDRGASPKVTNYRVFNPGTILAKLAKLWSSEGKRLLAKSLLFEPPGGYLL